MTIEGDLAFLLLTFSLNTSEFGHVFSHCDLSNVQRMICTNPVIYKLKGTSRLHVDNWMCHNHMTVRIIGANRDSDA